MKNLPKCIILITYNRYENNYTFTIVGLLPSHAGTTDNRMVTDGREWIIETTNQNGLEVSGKRNRTLKASTLSNRGYERSEHPRIRLPIQ